jgi:hypothetical protein
MSRMKSSVLVAVVGMVFELGIVSTVGGATINVPSSSYPTLNSALAVSQPYDIIQIIPGYPLYESVIISKPNLTIRGYGTTGRGTIVAINEDGLVIKKGADNLLFERIVFRADAASMGSGITIERGVYRPVFKECTFSAPSLTQLYSCGVLDYGASFTKIDKGLIKFSFINAYLGMDNNGTYISNSDISGKWYSFRSFLSSSTINIMEYFYNNMCGNTFEISNSNKGSWVNMIVRNGNRFWRDYPDGHWTMCLYGLVATYLNNNNFDICRSYAWYLGNGAYLISETENTFNEAKCPD